MIYYIDDLLCENGPSSFGPMVAYQMEEDFLKSLNGEKKKLPCVFY